MNVSLDVGVALFDGAKPGRTADSLHKDFGETMRQSEAEQEKGGSSGIGVGLPHQLSIEEHQRVENLKSLAMHIASEAKGSLTGTEEAQIKSIESEIGKITGMPMKENLVVPAKKIAEQNQVELDSENEAKFEDMTGKNQNDPSERIDSSGQIGGMRMVQNNALVTQIKCMSSGL